jgi:hypothetical protein
MLVFFAILVTSWLYQYIVNIGIFARELHSIALRCAPPKKNRTKSTVRIAVRGDSRLARKASKKIKAHRVFVWVDLHDFRGAEAYR